MHSRIARRAMLQACCGAVVLLHAIGAAAHGEKPHGVAWPGGNHFERSVRSYAIPEVVLIDADARPVRLRELFASDDPVMVNFIFTTCSTICPVMVRVFADVPSRLGAAAKNLRMISISIDPENDTPAQLKSYAKNFGSDLQWRFLTGRLEDIKNVQRAFDVYRGDKMSHEPLTLIRHARAKTWVRIDGFANPDELASEYLRTTVK
ncbi:MAG: SCO family protein [Burkholderiales bacterium]